MPVTTKLYFCNQSAPYTPSTIRGAWDQTSGSPVTGLLAPGPSGGATTKGIAETNTSPTWDVLVARFISQPLTTGNAFITTDTFRMIIGWLESNAAADDVAHIYAYVTTGDSDTQRGVLINDTVASPLSSEELPTTATGQLFNNNSAIALSNNVTAIAGDRIVIEIGYQAQNSVSTSRTGTINYGNTGTTDLGDGDTNVTTRPGFIEFTTTLPLFFELGEIESSLGAGASFPVKPENPQLNWGHPLARGLVMDMNWAGRQTIPRDLVSKDRPTIVSTPLPTQEKFGSVINIDATGHGMFLTNASRYRVPQINSFECLIYIRTFPPTGQSYLAEIYNDDDDSGNVSAIWRIGSKGDSTLNKRFGINFKPDAVTDTDIENDNDLPQSQWVHIVVVCDGTNITWYVNGKQDTQKSYSITPQVNTLNWYIGFANNGGSLRPLDGLISHIRRWNNRALTKLEVRELYENPWRIYQQLKPLYFNSISAGVTVTPQRMRMGMGA